MLSGIGALLEDFAVRRLDHHAETVENTDVTRFVDGVDDGVRPLNINRDPCVSWDVDALELKQEPAHGHSAFDSCCSFPHRVTAVGLQRPSPSRRELTSGCGFGVHRRSLIQGRWRQCVLIHRPERVADKQPEQQCEDGRNNPDQPGPPRDSWPSHRIKSEE